MIVNATVRVLTLSDACTVLNTRVTLSRSGRSSCPTVPGFFGRRGLRVSTRAAAIFWLGCVRTSPCRCASLGYYVCVLRQAWARVRVAHVRMRSAPACVPWCVSREGGQSSGACCGCGASRMSGVARRRASMPVCVHASLPPSLLGRPSVIGYREARPCQARVVRTLYSCEARRWVHGTQRGEGSCARCVRTMRIMLCYVMLCVIVGVSRTGPGLVTANTKTPSTPLGALGRRVCRAP